MSTNAIIILLIILVVAYFAYKKSMEGFLERQMNGNLQVDLASERSRKSNAVIENFLERPMNGNLQVDLASDRVRKSNAVIENYGDMLKGDTSYGNRNYEQFNNYHGDPSIDDETINNNRLNSDGAGIYTEFLRSSVDPSLQTRQTNFIKDINDGDLSKNSYSAVQTARYITREAEAPSGVIGLRPSRRVYIDYNQKQVTETLPEDSYADEDPSIGASVLGRQYQW